MSTVVKIWKVRRADDDKARPDWVQKLFSQGILSYGRHGDNDIPFVLNLKANGIVYTTDIRRGDPEYERFLIWDPSLALSAEACRLLTRGEAMRQLPDLLELTSHDNEEGTSEPTPDDEVLMFTPEKYVKVWRIQRRDSAKPEWVQNLLSKGVVHYYSDINGTYLQVGNPTGEDKGRPIVRILNEAQPSYYLVHDIDKVYLKTRCTLMTQQERDLMVQTLREHFSNTELKTIQEPREDVYLRVWPIKHPIDPQEPRPSWVQQLLDSGRLFYRVNSPSSYTVALRCLDSSPEYTYTEVRQGYQFYLVTEPSRAPNDYDILNEEKTQVLVRRVNAEVNGSAKSADDCVRDKLIELVAAAPEGTYGLKASLEAAGAREKYRWIRLIATNNGVSTVIGSGEHVNGTTYDFAWGLLRLVEDMKQTGAFLYQRDTAGNVVYSFSYSQLADGSVTYRQEAPVVITDVPEKEQVEMISAQRAENRMVRACYAFLAASHTKDGHGVVSNIRRLERALAILKTAHGIGIKRK